MHKCSKNINIRVFGITDFVRTVICSEIIVMGSYGNDKLRNTILFHDTIL